MQGPRYLERALFILDGREVCLGINQGSSTIDAPNSLERDAEERLGTVGLRCCSSQSQVGKCMCA